MNEQQAFNFMVQTYEQYKNGELSKEHLEAFNETAGEDWIEHVENELIQMGLQFHKIVQEQEQEQ